MKIFVFGYYGYKNTGDDAMKLAVVSELKNRGHEVVSYYKGDSLRKTLSNFLKAEIVAIGGGTHLRNWGKGWWFCSGRVLFLGIVSRLLGKRFNMINVGSGGKRLDFLASVISSKVTQRDTETMDSAVLLDFKPLPKEKILGINLQSMSSIYYDDYELDEKMLISVCKSVNEWKRSHPDWKVRFVSFNGNDYYPDDEICYRASLLVPGSYLYTYNPDVREVLSEMSSLSAFAGMRYHSLVFAYMTNTPFVAIYTYPRCKSFNTAVHNGFEPIDIDSITKGWLTSILSVLTRVKNRNILPLADAKYLAWKGLDV